jgi:hypothetical protein
LENPIKLSGENCYGQVEYASITIRGLVLPAFVSWRMYEWEAFTYSLLLEPKEKEHEFSADVRLEEHTFNMHVDSPGRSLRRPTTKDNQLVERVPVWILSLGHHVEQDWIEEVPKYWQHCLVLGPSPISTTAYEDWATLISTERFLGIGRTISKKKDPRPLLSFKLLDLIYPL